MANAGLEDDLTLVLGGTGKTGRRVADRLRQAGRGLRIGSRNAGPRFDWTPLADGVQRALGRPPREFSDYVRRTAATGVWGGIHT